MKSVLESIRSRIPYNYEICFKDSCVVTYAEHRNFDPKTWCVSYGRYELAVIELDKKSISVYDKTLYIMLKEVGRLHGFDVGMAGLEKEKPVGIINNLWRTE
jgi:hypothetical protein